MIYIPVYILYIGENKVDVSKLGLKFAAAISISLLRLTFLHCFCKDVTLTIIVTTCTFDAKDVSSSNHFMDMYKADRLCVIL